MAPPAPGCRWRKFGPWSGPDGWRSRSEGDGRQWHEDGVPGVPRVHVPGGRPCREVTPPPGWNSDGPLKDNFGPWQRFTDDQVWEADFTLSEDLRIAYSHWLCLHLRYRTAHPHALALDDCVQWLSWYAPPDLPPPVTDKTVWELLVNNWRYELAREWPRGVPGVCHMGLWLPLGLPGAAKPSSWWVRCFNRRCRRCLREAKLPAPRSGVSWQSTSW